MHRTATILHSDAIVLRAIDYGESSRIVTLFTRELGKIGVMAKGARASKSRFGSTLEPLSHIHVVVFVKPGRELQIISEATHIHTHDALRQSLERIESGIRIIELTSSLIDTGGQQEEVFGLLAGSLLALDTAPSRTGNIWPFYQLRMAAALGFGPTFDADFIKGMVEPKGILDLKSGEITLQSEEGYVAYPGSREALRAFAVLSRAHLSNVVRMELSPSVALEVNAMVTAYLKYHVEDAYPNRSAKVFAQLSKANERI